MREITIGHLLSMQAGLGRTSGANYGRWVASPSWVRAALAEPFADEPGGGMLYSTGSTHLLSAILTRGRGSRRSRSHATGWGRCRVFRSPPGSATRRGSISAATRCR